MFGRTPKDESIKLDTITTRILNDMDTYGPDSPEYPVLLEHLEKINNLRSSKDRRRVSPDTMAIVLGNFLGILLIVAYEQKHVLTSKGLGFVQKTK